MTLFQQPTRQQNNSPQATFANLVLPTNLPGLNGGDIKDFLAAQYEKEIALEAARALKEQVRAQKERDEEEARRAREALEREKQAAYTNVVTISPDAARLSESDRVDVVNRAALRVGTQNTMAEGFAAVIPIGNAGPTRAATEENFRRTVQEEATAEAARLGPERARRPVSEREQREIDAKTRNLDQMFEILSPAQRELLARTEFNTAKSPGMKDAIRDFASRYNIEVDPDSPENRRG